MCLNLTRIFERCYRVDKARSKQTGGTGLGLSIVRHVAENHGGRVTVESTLGEGSTFTIYLPRG
jgi:two-component system, OmpR family, sensor histidine kinase SenX3